MELAPFRPVPGGSSAGLVLTEDEHVRPTSVRRIYRIARPELVAPDLERRLGEFAAAVRAGDEARLHDGLRALVPDFRA